MLRIRTVMTGVAGTPWYTNVYFDGTAANAPASRTRMLNFWTALAPQIRQDLTWQVEPEVAIVDPLFGEITGYTNTGTGTPGTGSSIGQPLPAANQGLISLATNAVSRSRAVRGRIFVPGLTFNGTTDGRPSSAAITAMNSAAAALFDGSTGTRAVVWARPLDPRGIWPLRPGQAIQVTSASVWSEYAVLRSRRD